MSRYLAWFNKRQPPSIVSMRRPSFSGVRLSRSGARNVSIAVRQSSTGTRARLASPGIEPHTLPCRSAIAIIVIHTRRVRSGSHHTVDSVIELNSLVNVIDMVYPIVYGVYPHPTLPAAGLQARGDVLRA